MKKLLLTLLVILAASLPSLAQKTTKAVVKSIDFSNTNWGKTTGSYDGSATSTDELWKITNFNQNNGSWDYIRCGKKGSSSSPVKSTAYIQSLKAIDSDITEVEIEVNWLRATVNSISILTADNAQFSNAVEVASQKSFSFNSNNKNATITLNYPNVKGKYIELVFEVTNNTTSSGVL